MKNLEKKIQLALDAFKSGKILEAKNMTKELIGLNPNIVFLYNLLGLIFASQNEFDQALEYYEKGIKIDPNFSIIYNNLGLLYANNALDNKKAENFYKKSISLNKKNPEAQNNLGNLYKSLDKFYDAIDCYKKAISLDSRFVHSYHNLGNVYVTLGNFSEAKKNFSTAIKIDPKYTNSHRTLSRLINYTDNNKHFFELKNIYKKINIKDTLNKSNIAFALGKVYENIKDYNKSFIFYKEANDLYNSRIDYSIKREKEKFVKVKSLFNKKIFEQYRGTGNEDLSSIFILGMPRSGTTLIEQILSSHPKVFGADEKNFIEILLHKHFENKFDNLKLFLEENVNLYQDNFKKIGDEYLDKIKNISDNSERSTNKLPENFFWIGFIKLIFPKSRIVHCHRNPKDNCFSIYKNHFPDGKINYSFDLKNIVEYYNLYSDLMKYWNNLLPSFVYNIKYENLILNTESEIRNLLKICNLDWNDNCLNFHKNMRAVKTASDIQARSKIFNSSIDSWKNYKENLNVYLDKLKN